MRASRHAMPHRPPGRRRSPASWRLRWAALRPLSREIVLVLAIKAVALALLWFAFFRAPVAPQMAMAPAAVADRVLAPEIPHGGP